MQNFIPEVGSWYQDLQQGFIFEVVAVDETSGTVETQHQDGEIGEYDLDTWKQLSLGPAEAPEDWRASYELSTEDSNDPDCPLYPENWSGILNSIEADNPLDFDDFL